MKTPSLSALLLLLCLAPVAVWGDDDDDDDDDDRRPARAAVAPLPLTAERAQYEAECGSCHMAYAPGMLPARSWTKLLAGLDAHFGQNAELDAATVRTLSAWLAANAAEAGTHPLSQKVLKSARGQTPLRLSELGFIQREHAEELSPAVFARRSVASVANCGACHTRAAEGSFREREISVPR